MVNDVKKFINELGNQVSVSVIEKPIKGVDGVLVSIEGPTSHTENHITKEEAKVILEELSKVLNSGSK